ncbi:hypothetical protein SAMN05421505_1552 [Sinosporangium album]|uniref:Uncharacterized protein n=1 Tax=Sinosporangium album TaxID=504805 RepID=A0A1G8KTD3_9ACTN|nr:hypothetical protein [Sinosporangium album]SDI46678.1 hypothetical protein SAMN05421505_1552 [Sinosporangium album]
MYVLHDQARTLLATAPTFTEAERKLAELTRDTGDGQWTITDTATGQAVATLIRSGPVPGIPLIEQLTADDPPA